MTIPVNEYNTWQYNVPGHIYAIELETISELNRKALETL